MALELTLRPPVVPPHANSRPTPAFGAFESMLRALFVPPHVNPRRRSPSVPLLLRWSLHLPGRGGSLSIICRRPCALESTLRPLVVPPHANSRPPPPFGTPAPALAIALIGVRGCPRIGDERPARPAPHEFPPAAPRYPPLHRSFCLSGRGGNLNIIYRCPRALESILRAVLIPPHANSRPPPALGTPAPAPVGALIGSRG
ncbi:hypothetical protein C8R46DRAFT_1233958 [Mycena filopes]|nr:hypothetical protein C8R46DRAFT_1233958 [Mycena filopes]